MQRHYLFERFRPGAAWRRKLGRFPNFYPATFEWTGGDTPLLFQIQVLGMQLDGSEASVEMRIVDHGLHMVSILDRTDDRTSIYLSNFFIVPDALKRKGLATATLEAMRQCLDSTLAHESSRHDRVHLTGSFINEGIKFSSALCQGIIPSGSRPRLIDPARLAGAQRHLHMTIAPQLVTSTS